MTYQANGTLGVFFCTRSLQLLPVWLMM